MARGQLWGSVVGALLGLALLSGCAAAPVTQLLGPPPLVQVAEGLPDSPKSLDAVRKQLDQVLFGTDDVSGATSIGKAIEGPGTFISLPEQALDYLAESNSITMPLRFNLHNRATLLRPKQQKPCSFIWHDGHGDKPLFGGGDQVVTAALRAGCRVIIMQMPLKWPNPHVATLPNRAQVDLDEPYYISLHNRIAMLNTPERAAIDLFIAPVVGMVEFLKQIAPNDPVYMAGLSGGGWTTTVAAAADPRIEKSMNIAGSKTIPDLANCAGDYEQCLPELYSKVSMEQMYVLASSTAPRVHAQVLNRNDTCCYRGDRGTEYATQVTEASLAAGGGTFDFEVDDALYDHAVPPKAFAIIESWLT